MYLKLIIAILFTASLKGQVRHDTVIDCGIYKSYFNRALREPVAVTYTLYHGGGEASRKNDHFKDCKGCLTAKDYSHSGYDRGHLAPAEDFAYSDSLEALTFSYYNCVPQLSKLNRGKWKAYESKVRKLSQLDTIIVVCYNEFKSISPGLNIPVTCYKAVYNLKGESLLKIGFQNTGECEKN